ncbi:MAG: hypothetical protein IJ881_00575 [Neisseriaceae bacterium]|nr:hypothetical protein [Neisseriaceae bacterium]
MFLNLELLLVRLALPFVQMMRRRRLMPWQNLRLRPLYPPNWRRLLLIHRLLLRLVMLTLLIVPRLSQNSQQTAHLRRHYLRPFPHLPAQYLFVLSNSTQFPDSTKTIFLTLPVSPDLATDAQFLFP